MSASPRAPGVGPRHDDISSVGNKAHPSMPPPIDQTQKNNSTMVVTPAMALQEASLKKRMSVDKNIVDELLLVCGVIGTTTTVVHKNDNDTNDNNTNNTPEQQLVPVTDCLNWLQDLQRALRRDDDLYRPISLLLGQWKIVTQKLLPLVLHSRYDTTMVLTVCKILVILTKPLAENTVRAARVVIDTKSKKVSERVIREQQKLRANALEQADTLLEYKRAICFHPSHTQKRRGAASNHNDTSSNSNNGRSPGGVLSIFVSLLAEPLSRTGNARTDADHLTIELVLHLVRNLLAADSLFQDPAAQELHHAFVALLDQEVVLDLLLVLAADLEQRENAPYNLLVMELLQHLLRHQDPTVVAQSNKVLRERSAAVVSSTTEPHHRNHSSATARRSTTTPKPSRRTALSSTLKRERSTLLSTATSRHGHFGGTLVVETESGQKQLVSASLLSSGRHHNGTSSSSTTNSRLQQQRKRRKSKQSHPFLGAHSRTSTYRHDAVSTPAATRAAQTLDRFCRRFCDDAYGPVVKSLKNEFRRDSVRLEGGDKVVFFRIVWFLCQWWRASGGSQRQKERVRLAQQDAAAASTDDPAGDGAVSNASLIGHLIFTMDIFTFNLVLNATDTFTEHKQHTPLAQSVALLSEMMHLLYIMFSSQESTEQFMAFGLMDRLFYSKEPLDRLPKLLAKWTPGASTREYCCDLVEVCHITMKLLDANAKADIGAAEKLDSLGKMKVAAADFDVPSYFSRKIISNHNMVMYTHLLSQYAINAPVVNHRAVAFFLRLSKHKISSEEESNVSGMDGTIPKNPLAGKTVTYEPMLYNLHMLSTLNSILNDLTIRNDKNYATVLQFASTFVYKFSQAAQINPLLYIEALFKHPLPHRYCETICNQYVSEDLRMMAERDILLEHQRRLERETAALQNADDDDDDSDDESDEELEFMDVPAPAGDLADSDDGDDVHKSAAKKPKLDSQSKRNRTSATSMALDDSDDDADVSPAVAKTGSKHELDDSDDDSDADGPSGVAGRRLKRIADKSKEQSKTMKKMLKSMDSIGNGSSSDDESVVSIAKEGSAKVLRAKAVQATDSGLVDSDDDE